MAKKIETHRRTGPGEQIPPQMQSPKIMEAARQPEWARIETPTKESADEYFKPCSAWSKAQFSKMRKRSYGSAASFSPSS
jgi:hypothetical protein